MFRGPQSIDALQRQAAKTWFQAQWSSLSSHSCSARVFLLLASLEDIWTVLVALVEA
jgi:hypothetical protein